jgi:antitoxin HicB
MKLAYPATITYMKKDKIFLVEFPDLPGCLTDGTDMEDAKAMAAEALSGYLMSVIEGDLVFNPPSKVRGAVMIEPEPSVAFAYWLRTKRKASGMTLTDVADKLGVKYQVYQKLENPETSNPTLKTLKRLEKVFGEELVGV